MVTIDKGNFVKFFLDENGFDISEIQDKMLDCIIDSGFSSYIRSFRQSGKTTLLVALAKYLDKNTQYKIYYVSYSRESIDLPMTIRPVNRFIRDAESLPKEKLDNSVVLFDELDYINIHTDLLGKIVNKVGMTTKSTNHKSEYKKFFDKEMHLTMDKG